MTHEKLQARYKYNSSAASKGAPVAGKERKQKRRRNLIVGALMVALSGVIVVLLWHAIDSDSTHGGFGEL